jgi:hypothetical protein
MHVAFRLKKKKLDGKRPPTRRRHKKYTIIIRAGCVHMVWNRDMLLDPVNAVNKSAVL